MDDTRARREIATALSAVVPGVVLDGIAPTADLRVVLDLDSLDFLTLVEALADATGVEIPEADYGRVGSLDQLSAYLVARSA